jgi:hypothetical protein
MHSTCRYGAGKELYCTYIHTQRKKMEYGTVKKAEGWRIRNMKLAWRTREGGERKGDRGKEQ